MKRNKVLEVEFTWMTAYMQIISKLLYLLVVLLVLTKHIFELHLNYFGFLYAQFI